MSAGLRERVFDDFPVGTVVHTRARTITETDVVNFAGLTWDSYPLHTDAEYARSTRFGSRIAHGPLVYCFSIGIMPIEFFGDAIVAFLGVENLRHRAPVAIGDTIRVEARVIEATVTSGNDSGIVRIEYITKNQRNEAVMDMTAIFLMRRGRPAGPTGAGAPQGT